VVDGHAVGPAGGVFVVVVEFEGVFEFEFEGGLGLA
jgi:hypothetical protein